MIYRFNCAAAALLWTGMASVQAGAAVNDPAPAPVSWPIEVGVYRVAPEASVIEPGAQFIARFPLKNSAATAWSGQLHFTLLDFHEQERAVRDAAVTLKPAEARTVEVPFTAPEQGIFKIAVRVEANGRVWEKDVASFAAFPDRTNTRNKDSFFGYHVNAFVAPQLKQAARLGLAWNRGHNMIQYTWWPRVEPEKGEFKFLGESQREAVKQSGMQVLGQFFGTPYWAKAGGPGEKPATYYTYPRGDRPDTEAFGKYVFETVKHHPEIRYWEVWNEPDVSSFWRGSAEDLAELCQVAAKSAHAADPNVSVIAAGFTGSGLAWQKAAARAGLFKGIDGVSFHGYYSAEAAPETLEAQFTKLVNHFRELPQLSGVTKPLPLWDTESGSGDSTFLRGFETADGASVKMNWRSAAITTVQQAAILQSLGVVRSFTYLWNGSYPDDYSSSNALDRSGAPRPKVVARAAMAQLVDGGYHAGVIKRPEGRLTIHAYQLADGKSLLLAWTGRGGRVTLDRLPDLQPVEQLDIMGRTTAPGAEWSVSEEPSYLKCTPDAATVLKLLSTYPVKVNREPEPAPATNNVLAPEIPELGDFVPGTRDFSPVDLKAVVNMGLADEAAGDERGGWADEGPYNDARDLPTGRQKFYGVPFEIIPPAANGGKSVLTMKSRRLTPNLPGEVQGIALGNQRARYLYFLHTASWGTPGVIGKYVVHYADGQSVELPIRIPRPSNDTGNSNNWWAGAVGGEESRAVPFLVKNTMNGEPAYRYLRVWEWKNPRPDVPMTALDVISAGGDQTPILVAVTAAR